MVFLALGATSAEALGPDRYLVTGRLTGTPTPANVGTTASIIISVSDNIATVSLPGFTIQVTAPANRAPTAAVFG